MKKLYASILGLAVAAMASAASYTIPYHSDMTENDAISDDWLSADMDGDAIFMQTTSFGKYAWYYPSTSLDKSQFVQGGYNFGMIIYFDNAIVPDDYLISPQLQLEAGKEYIVRFAYATTNNADNNISIEGLLCTKRTAASAKEGMKLWDKTYGTNKVWHRAGYRFMVAEDGKYCIALHAYAKTGATKFHLADFSVEEYAFVPAGITGLTATCGTTDDARALSAKLAWTNPTADRDEVPFADGQALESVTIYRDGDELPVATITDGASTWTDTEATGLTPGYHTYTLVASAAGVESAPASVTTSYVGPVMPFNIPAEVSFPSNDDFTLLWSTAKGANQKLVTVVTTTADNVTTETSAAYTAAWKLSSSTTYGNSAKFLSTASTKTSTSAKITEKNYQNDYWLWSPEFNFNLAGVYSVTLDYIVYKSSKPDRETLVTLSLGTDPKLTDNDWAGSQMISEKLPSTYTNSQASVRQDPIEFAVDTPGVYRFGFHATGLGNGASATLFGMQVDLIAASESGVESVAAAEASAKIAGNEVVLSAQGDVTVYNIAGAAVKGAKAIESLSLGELASGIYVVVANIEGETVTLKIAK